MKKILICFGTRPEWIKIKPLVDILPNAKLLFTGQHLDLLSTISTDYTIKIKENANRLDQVLSDCMLGFPDENFDYVVVHGDTVSALGCALAAYSRGIKVVHLEAGLRSHDLKAPFPEEGYRQMISRISSINFAPTSLSANNLISERVLGKVFIVGNSVLDNLVSLKEDCEYSNKVLVTLHRWENHQRMNEWFQAVEDIANNNPELEFIIPLHPNPNVSKHKNIFSKVKVVDPLSHTELLGILTKCMFVISDSGGIQEEASFFNKRVIVCRSTTERPEGLTSGHLILSPTPELLHLSVKEILNNYFINAACPYGDGRTAVKVKNILDNE